MAAITGIGKFSKLLMRVRALATKGPTSDGAIPARSFRSAPAQNIPGVVLRKITTRQFLSNRTASTASDRSRTRFLLNEFLA